MSDGLLTLSAYARHRGVSQPYISKLVKLGKCPTVDGKIDPDAADRALADSSDPRRDAVRSANAVRRSVPAERIEPSAPAFESSADLFEGMTQTEAQTAKLRIQAKRETLDYDREIGKVVELAAVNSAIADLVPNAATLLDGLPDRIAARVAAESDVRTVYAIIEAECTAVRQSIADFGRALLERLTVNPS